MTLSGPVLAQDGGLRPLPQLTQEFDLTGYASQTDTISRTSDAIPYVSFKVSLPKNWTERTALGQSFGELYRFDGPAFGDVRPYFSLQREQMRRENTAKGELIAHMLKSGYVLRGLNEIDDRNVDAFYVKYSPNGDSFAVRARARVMGDSLVVAEYALPVHAFGDAADTQTFAMQSFEFLKDNDAPVERWIPRRYGPSVSFSYPASWRFVGEETDEVNQVRINLENQGSEGVVSGSIKLNVYSSRNLMLPESRERFEVDVPAILRGIKPRYEAERLVIGKHLETKVPKLDVPVKFSSLDVYPVRPRLTDYQTDRTPSANQELWVAMLQTDEAVPRTILVEMLTPAREHNVYVWGVNARAFEMILKSIK